MRSNISRSIVSVSVLLASTPLATVSTSARAEDAAALQRLEAKIQQLEERHENEIKNLQAEIKRLRKQKPAASVATAELHPREQAASPLLPPGLPPPATPAKVLMTYDRGYHFGFSDATGENTVELLGRLQIDTGGYTRYSRPRRHSIARVFRKASTCAAPASA